MKQYLCRETKPKNVEELKAGIKAVWNVTTIVFKKVIPKVNEEDGGPFIAETSSENRVQGSNSVTADVKGT